MIEVVVAEVTLDSNQKLGFSAAGMLNRLFHSATSAEFSPISLSPVSTREQPAPHSMLRQPAFQFVLNNANYSAVLQALDDSTNVNILATPKVFTSNNQQATIDIQQFIPYITGQGFERRHRHYRRQSSPVPPGRVQSGRHSPYHAGWTGHDGSYPGSQRTAELSDPGNGSGRYPGPCDQRPYTDTEVTVQDNETIVIGGLIRQSTISTGSKFRSLATSR